MQQDFPSEINIWEFGSKINVKVTREFLDLINFKIKEKFKSKRNVHKELVKYYSVPFSTFKARLKPSYKSFVDLEIFYNLCNLLEISLFDFQKNILAYKTRGGGNCIENPVLPVKINCLISMLTAHHIGDGCVVNSGYGRKPYFAYRQFNKLYRDLYIKKIESLFGKLNYKTNYFDSKDVTRIYFPIACAELMFGLYNLNAKSFMSETARIPENILIADEKHKLAFLLGVIIDEGHIDSCLIVIRLKNKALIEDLKKLCEALNYEVSVNLTGEMCCLYILSKSLNKFYFDYQNLLSEFPEVNLGYKEVQIKQFLLRQNKPKIYVEGNKNLILTKLLKENLTVNELALSLNMTRQGARYLIKELINENKIELKRIISFRNYQYGLK